MNKEKKKSSIVYPPVIYKKKKNDNNKDSVKDKKHDLLFVSLTFPTLRSQYFRVNESKSVNIFDLSKLQKLVKCQTKMESLFYV